MKNHSTKPHHRLRCRHCQGTHIQPTTTEGRTRRRTQMPDIFVTCLDCGHGWYSKARAAQALRYSALEAIGQRTLLWDERPSKKYLTPPPHQE